MAIPGTIEAILNAQEALGIGRTIRKRTRNRRPLPPLEARDWMTANEAAVALGCSVATIH